MLVFFLTMAMRAGDPRRFSGAFRGFVGSERTKSSASILCLKFSIVASARCQPAHVRPADIDRQRSVLDEAVQSASPQ